LRLLDLAFRCPRGTGTRSERAYALGDSALTLSPRIRTLDSFRLELLAGLLASLTQMGIAMAWEVNPPVQP